MLICPHSYLSVDHSVFFNTDLGIFQGRIRKKKGIFIQVPTVLMARFGLFGCRFLISSPVPPPPPPKKCTYYGINIRHFGIGSNYSASRFEFVMIKAFVSWNAGKVPN